MRSSEPLEIESSGPDDTALIAECLAAELVPGDVVLLTGDVGSGKSTLARAAMRSLGVEGPIPSPTFTVGRLYAGDQGMTVAHLDLYRIDSIEDEDPGLLSEYLDPRGIVFAEWPGQGSEHILQHAKRTRTITIEHLDRERRLIRVGPLGPR